MSSSAVVLLRNIRRCGWYVAAHNDYFMGKGKDRTFYTYWQFNNPTTGRFVKGEGKTDEEALRLCWDQIINQANGEGEA